MRSYAALSKSPDSIKAALLSYGPVSAGIHGTSLGLLHYSSGVLGDREIERLECSGKSLNHAVLIVGWGKDELGEYWKVENR